MAYLGREWVLALSGAEDTDAESPLYNKERLMSPQKPAYPSLEYRTKRLLGRLVDCFSFLPAVRMTRLVATLEAREALPTRVDRFRTLRPAEEVNFGAARDKPFLEACKYFNEGRFSRSETSVYEAPRARLHVGTGTVLTSDCRVLVDSEMDYRMPFVRGAIPLKKRWGVFFPERLQGTYAILGGSFFPNYWHFLFDNLAKVYSLFLDQPGRQLTIVMPASLNPLYREMLELVVAGEFGIRYVEDDKWLQVDRLVIPSYVSRRANGYLPPEYTEFVRDRIFSGLGLPRASNPSERIYVSRRRAEYRRVLNEDQVEACLAPFGFRSVVLEDMTLRDQVDLFRKAEIVVAPAGAGLGTTLFSGPIKVVVLYPNQRPTSFFVTQINRLGQQHHWLLGDAASEDVDFLVDIEELRRVLGAQIAPQTSART